MEVSTVMRPLRLDEPDYLVKRYTGTILATYQKCVAVVVNGQPQFDKSREPRHMHGSSVYVESNLNNAAFWACGVASGRESIDGVLHMPVVLEGEILRSKLLPERLMPGEPFPVSKIWILVNDVWRDVMGYRPANGDFLEENPIHLLRQ